MNRIRLLFLLTVLCMPYPGKSGEPAGTIDVKVADNEALKAIFDADQSDRTSGALQRDAEAVLARDRARRDLALEMVRKGELHTARDYFYAAMVFQHSHEDIRLAHALSTIATYLDRENKQYRWLVAASWDRLLMQHVQPQWYGTQYQSDDQGLFLYPVAENAVTDEERTGMGVPSLQESRAQLKDMAAMVGGKPRDTAPTITELQAKGRLDFGRTPTKDDDAQEE